MDEVFGAVAEFLFFFFAAQALAGVDGLSVAVDVLDAGGAFVEVGFEFGGDIGGEISLDVIDDEVDALLAVHHVRPPSAK